MGCCDSIARTILIIFNILFFLLGAAALAVGIWVLVDATIFLDLLSKIPTDTTTYANLIQDAAYIFIAAGGAIFLVGFLGCCGAWKKVKVLLLVYAIIVILVILLEIACVIVAYFFTSTLDKLITVDLAGWLLASYNSTFTATADPAVYSYSGADGLSRGVDAIQIEFSCCGVNNHTDYASTNTSLTCCPVDTTGFAGTFNEIWKGTTSSFTFTSDCPTNSSNPGNQNTGCYQAITDYVLGKSWIFIGIGAGILGIEILVIIFACCLIRTINKENQVA